MKLKFATPGVIAGVLIMGAAFTGCAPTKQPQVIGGYEQGLIRNLEERYGIESRVFDCDELTEEIVTSRDGDLIIERIVGVSLGNTGDGRILNPADSRYDYMSYTNAGISNLERGTVVATYLVFNPDTNGEDDIVERYDRVIGYNAIEE